MYFAVNEGFLLFKELRLEIVDILVIGVFLRFA